MIDGGVSANDSNHLNTPDLVTGNYILNIPCYGDGEDTTAAIIGFTITHGWNAYRSGIYINNSSPTCSHLIIKNNLAVANFESKAGSGLFLSNSNFFHSLRCR